MLLESSSKFFVVLPHPRPFDNISHKTTRLSHMSNMPTFVLGVKKLGHKYINTIASTRTHPCTDSKRQIPSMWVVAPGESHSATCSVKSPEAKAQITCIKPGKTKRNYGDIFSLATKSTTSGTASFLATTCPLGYETVSCKCSSASRRCLQGFQLKTYNILQPGFVG